MHERLHIFAIFFALFEVLTQVFFVCWWNPHDINARATVRHILWLTIKMSLLFCFWLQFYLEKSHSKEAPFRTLTNCFIIKLQMEFANSDKSMLLTKVEKLNENLNTWQNPRTKYAFHREFREAVDFKSTTKLSNKCLINSVRFRYRAAQSKRGQNTS